MPDYLLDTGPLVRHLRNRRDATQLLADLTTRGSLYSFSDYCTFLREDLTPKPIYIEVQKYARGR